MWMFAFFQISWSLKLVIVFSQILLISPYYQGIIYWHAYSYDSHDQHKLWVVDLKIIRGHRWTLKVKGWSLKVNRRSNWKNHPVFLYLPLYHIPDHNRIWHFNSKSLKRSPHVTRGHWISKWGQTWKVHSCTQYLPYIIIWNLWPS